MLSLTSSCNFTVPLYSATATCLPTSDITYNLTVTFIKKLDMRVQPFDKPTTQSTRIYGINKFVCDKHLCWVHTNLLTFDVRQNIIVSHFRCLLPMKLTGNNTRNHCSRLKKNKDAKFHVSYQLPHQTHRNALFESSFVKNKIYPSFYKTTGCDTTTKATKAFHV